MIFGTQRSPLLCYFTVAFHLSLNFVVHILNEQALPYRHLLTGKALFGRFGDRLVRL
ncbi:hypothetical protein D3C77_718050 [compost metagenome]